jgi:hypothetical protein
MILGGKKKWIDHIKKVVKILTNPEPILPGKMTEIP